MDSGSMTEQEAAEIVLKNEKYVQCPHCDHGVVVSDECARCAGHGVLIREKYIQACKLLGITFSTRGWSLD